MNKFEAVIFDMDGVLIDSEPLWKIAMEEVFHSVGCMITKKDFQNTVGLRIDEVVRYWYNERGWKELTPQDVEHKIVQRMVELINENAHPLPGVMETLKYLSQKGYKIGLATSSYTVLIETVLHALKVESFFQCTHSAEDEVYGKPHPAVYLSVANELNTEPPQCLVIEDSLNGIISAKAARMQVVCIPEKSHHPEPKLVIADHMFEDMSEMLETIKRYD